MCRIHLEELISSVSFPTHYNSVSVLIIILIFPLLNQGSRHQSSMIICQCVADRIKSLENENLQSVGNNRYDLSPIKLLA
jgi:hypothetical protein